MENVSFGHGSKALSQREGRRRTVEMLVLSLAEIGDCRGGRSHRRRRLLADFLGGGGRQLRMSGLNLHDALLERTTTPLTSPFSFLAPPPYTMSKPTPSLPNFWASPSNTTAPTTPSLSPTLVTSPLSSLASVPLASNTPPPLSFTHHLPTAPVPPSPPPPSTLPLQPHPPKPKNYK
jgi:hypothetical protein